MELSETEFRNRHRDSSGGGRIRTYEAATLTVFETVAFDHSATPPPLHDGTMNKKRIIHDHCTCSNSNELQRLKGLTDSKLPYGQAYLDGFLDGEDGELGKRVPKPKN